MFGLSVAERTFAALDPEVRLERLTAEGVWREGGEVLRVHGTPPRCSPPSAPR